MMWRLFAVVVLLASRQACHAEELVNLANPVIPWRISYYPRFKDVRFNGDSSIRAKIPGHQGTNEFTIVEYGTDERISPTRYRITVPRDVAKKDYPSSWKLEGYDSYIEYDDTMDVVTGAVFKDGVYEGTLPTPGPIGIFSFIFYNRKAVTIASIELLGPRKTLDAMWPHGKYPCSRRLDWVGPPTGPARIFSRPRAGKRSEEKLRNLFNLSRKEDSYYKHRFDGFKPAIFGTILGKPTILREVVVQLYPEVGRIVVEGSFCQPNCRKYESKGWVKLAQRDGGRVNINHWTWQRLFIRNPDKYRGYRVKLYRGGTDRAFYPGGFWFLQCPDSS